MKSKALKYVDTAITFAEVPDEISLCINISGCTIRCPDCHSKWLWSDDGENLTPATIRDLMKRHEGITCVCIMGGKEEGVLHIASEVKNKGLKLAWYTGQEEYPSYELGLMLDYVKLGPYIAEKGPLTSKTTNQRFYRVDKSKTKVSIDSYGIVRPEINYVDITGKFRRKAYLENL